MELYLEPKPGEGKTYVDWSCADNSTKEEHMRNLTEDVYRNRESFNYWAKMSDNISRTLKEILIQKPELIPIVAKIMEEEENKKKLSNTLTLGEDEFKEDN